jgi:transposase-like protein
MAERGLTVDHSTIARWVLHYGPILQDRIRRDMRQPGRSWQVDEPVSILPESGHIYTGRSTRQDTRLTSCCRRTGI